MSGSLTALFVGGALDGEVREVERTFVGGVPQRQVAARAPKALVTWADAQANAVLQCEEDHYAYRPIRLFRRILHVYALEGLDVNLEEWTVRLLLNGTGQLLYAQGPPA